MTHEDIANKLLFPLWEGLDADYKARYKRNIWEQFENIIKTSAYTSKLNEFFSKMQNLLPISIMAKHLSYVNEILQSGEDKLILKALRQDTTYLVLQIRLVKQEQHELYLEEQELKQELKESKKKKIETNIGNLFGATE